MTSSSYLYLLDCLVTNLGCSLWFHKVKYQALRRHLWLIFKVQLKNWIIHFKKCTIQKFRKLDCTFQKLYNSNILKIELYISKIVQFKNFKNWMVHFTIIQSNCNWIVYFTIIHSKCDLIVYFTIIHSKCI